MSRTAALGPLPAAQLASSRTTPADASQPIRVFAPFMASTSNACWPLEYATARRPRQCRRTRWCSPRDACASPRGSLESGILRHMIRALAVVLLLILLGGTVYLATRPGQEVTSASNPEVVVTCDGSTGVSADHCRSWGD